VNGKPEIASKVLEQLGCACVTGALSSESADKLLAYVNAESERAKAAVTEGVVGFDERFGGVNCRGINGLFGNRQDMFVPMSEPLVRDSMEEIAANLAPFLKEAIGSEGMIHELSCLVADPGSPRRGIPPICGVCIPCLDWVQTNTHTHTHTHTHKCAYTNAHT
jgi:hypothetical protein